MPDLLVIAYPWLKVLHIICVILWMGTQFLLPILLATQRSLGPASPQTDLLVTVGRRLISHIMNPAMLATFVFGALLAAVVMDASDQLPRWLGFKLGFVFVLAALHGKLLKQFWRVSQGQPQWSSRGYSIVLWLSFGLLAGTVGLVVVKPGVG